MSQIFTEGAFAETYTSFSVSRLNEARKPINSYYETRGMISVFISHKHDELDDLNDIIGKLQKLYNVKCYIDSMDSSLPAKPNFRTAAGLKDRIKGCRKFILLATEGAIESKWCNWELGLGDGYKGDKNIAIFPLAKKGKASYSGNEYMSIYPYICKDGQSGVFATKYNNEELYVEIPNAYGGSRKMTLSQWLKS